MQKLEPRENLVVMSHAGNESHAKELCSMDVVKNNLRSEQDIATMMTTTAGWQLVVGASGAAPLAWRWRSDGDAAYDNDDDGDGDGGDDDVGDGDDEDEDGGEGDNDDGRF